jgi:hypothetical protein
MIYVQTINYIPRNKNGQRQSLPHIPPSENAMLHKKCYWAQNIYGMKKKYRALELPVHAALPRHCDYHTSSPDKTTIRIYHCHVSIVQSAEKII